jgi:hypothetical protein
MKSSPVSVSSHSKPNLNQHSTMNYHSKYCGTKAASIASLTAATCLRHPLGANKGQHEPAL